MRKREEKLVDKTLDFLVPPLWHKFKELYEAKYELAEDGSVVPLSGGNKSDDIQMNNLLTAAPKTYG